MDESCSVPDQLVVAADRDHLRFGESLVLLHFSLQIWDEAVVEHIFGCSGVDEQGGSVSVGLKLLPFVSSGVHECFL